MNTVKYKGNLAASTRRGPSPAIWGDCPVADLMEDHGLGMFFRDDFTVAGNAAMSSAFTGSIGQWQAYGAAGAVLADGAAEGGILTMGSNDDQEGVTLWSSTGSFRLVTTSTLALNGKLWFEARVARSTIADDKGDFFVGLCTPSLSSGLPAAAIPISTTDATMSTTPSFLGFHSVDKASVTYGSPDDWSLVFNLASGTVNAVTGLTTVVNTARSSAIAAAEFVKLGFIFDPFAYPKAISSATARQTAGQVVKPLLRVFVNGIELATFLSSADIQNATAGQAFPTSFMAPCLAVMNTTGSSPPTMSTDWIQVAQLANS